MSNPSKPVAGEPVVDEQLNQQQRDADLASRSADNQSDDPLNDKARRLEQIHQQLVSSKTDSEVPGTLSISDDELDSATHVLRLIERVRRVAAAPSTPNNPSTRHAVGDPAIPDVPSDPQSNLETPQVIDQETYDESFDWLKHNQPLPDTDTTPRRIGRFQVERLLGRGGSGLVFLAHDPRLLRRVALKIPRLDALLTGSLSERFMREAKAAALLSHPNIVSVFDAGFVGPAVYVASQFIPGPNLAEWLAEHGDQLAPLDAARTVAALASAVQHAHSRGVIHRDLKPSNIQVDQSDSLARSLGKSEPTSQATSLADQVRITDFGLARIESSADQATASGAVLGTPAYMSPEQARGDTAQSGASVDIYTLGVILYELLTGKPPHLKSSLAGTLRAVELDEPVAPSRSKSKVPRDLEAVCLKCLEKQPSRRYQSAFALESDLQRFIQGEPVLARRIGNWQRLNRWSRRNPALAAVSGLALLTFLVGFAMVAWQWQRAEGHLKAAVLATERANSEAIRSRQAADYARQALDDMTSQVASEWLLGQPQLTAEQKNFLQTAITHYRNFTSQSADDDTSAAQVASAAFQLGTLLRRLGETADAETAYRHAYDTWYDLARHYPETSRYRLQLARSSHALQIVTRTAGRVEEAETLGLFAIELLQQLLIESADADEIREELAKIYTNYGNLLRGTNRIEEATAAHTAAGNLLQQLMADDPDNPEHRQTYSMTLNNLAYARFVQRQFDGAIELYEQSLQIKEQLVLDFPGQRKYAEDLALGLINHGSLMERLGQMEPAEDHTRRAIDHYDQLIHVYPSRPDYRELQASALLNLGTIVRRQGRVDEAEPSFTRAIESLKELVQQYPESWSYAHMLAAGLEKLGDLERERDNLAQAAQRYTEAIDAVELHHQAQSDSIPIANRLMNGLIARATVRAWLAEYDESLADWDRAIGLSAPATRNGWRLARGTTLVRAGRDAEAIAEANELTLDSEDLAVLFNGACVYAMASGFEALPAEQRQQYSDQAIDLLGRCISRGFRDEAKLRTDPDLQPLRHLSAFEALLELSR